MNSKMSFEFKKRSVHQLEINQNSGESTTEDSGSHEVFSPNTSRIQAIESHPELILNERSAYIHKIAMIITYISMFVQAGNVLYDIVVLSIGSNMDLLSIDIIQTFLNFLGNASFVIATLIAVLYGSKTLGKVGPGPELQEKLGVLEELIHRYKHSNLKKEGLRIGEIMEEIVVPRENTELYEAVKNFRKSLQIQLVSRMGLSSAINVITGLFLYFNLLLNFIVYTNWYKLPPKSTRLLYFSLNVINPLICGVFSYIVVLCDNFNSAVEYTLRVKTVVKENNPRLVDTISEINDLKDRIERPLLKQLFNP
jgi:hypothetical protein